MIEAAAETFNDCALPFIGIFAVTPHLFRVSSLIPPPSLPRTSKSGPLGAEVNTASASLSNAMQQ